MIIKSKIIDVDVRVRELLNETAKFKENIKNNTLNGYRSDAPTLNKVDYTHRTSINRERENTDETLRRIILLDNHLEGASKGLNMLGDILLTMIEICEDASAVYVGEPNPKLLEHNIHLQRLKQEFYSVSKLYKVGNIPIFTFVTSNDVNEIETVNFNIHLDTDNSTRLVYESPRILEEATAISGTAANRPIISIDRVKYNNVETAYITPVVPPVTITTDIYANNVVVFEECISRIDNYKLELENLSTRVKLRRSNIENFFLLNMNKWKRDLQTLEDIEERISNNRFLMKKTEYNI